MDAGEDSLSPDPSLAHDGHGFGAAQAESGGLPRLGQDPSPLGARPTGGSSRAAMDAGEDSQAPPEKRGEDLDQ
eukprot:1276303-Pyramimonas_sp.AAC.1